MSVSVLATKLVVPPTWADLVPRQRLVDRLNEGFQAGRRLILISAPAGFGKTTLASAWAQKSVLQRHLAWLSLDADDNDPARFLTYLVHALQRMHEALGETARAIGLNLSAENLAALEGRSGGSIVRLHLAALALRGIPGSSEKTRLVWAFRGSHQYC